MSNQTLNYRCPKCGNTSCEVDEMRATGGILSQLMDIQNKRFTSVTCTRCQYTEFFRVESSMLGNIFDFFTQ